MADPWRGILGGKSCMPSLLYQAEGTSAIPGRFSMLKSLGNLSNESFREEIRFSRKCILSGPKAL